MRFATQRRRSRSQARQLRGAPQVAGVYDSAPRKGQQEAGRGGPEDFKKGAIAIRPQTDVFPTSLPALSYGVASLK